MTDVFETLETQEPVQSLKEANASFWGPLNAAYTARNEDDEFQADYYWPTKDRQLPEGNLTVEITNVRPCKKGDQRKLHFHLRLVSSGKTAIKSYRMVPESMPFLRKDMERLGVHVDDARKVLPEVRKLINKPVLAKLYFNERTKWQDLDFMSATVPESKAETADEFPADHDPFKASDDADWLGFGY